MTRGPRRLVTEDIDDDETTGDNSALERAAYFQKLAQEAAEQAAKEKAAEEAAEAAAAKEAAVEAPARWSTVTVAGSGGG
ncbi:hypothetical protein VE03_06534 [Pseudogymnoascus sp. 23342-1-I1]|nr:hypothetical protein VE03_06534 [Pseudogymnoascus sp. 23342-1-I1]